MKAIVEPKQTFVRGQWNCCLQRGDDILPEVNIAVSLNSLNQPFKQALHTAARLGAKGVEIDVRKTLAPDELSDTGRRALRKLMDDLNLRVATLRFQTQRGYDVVQDLDRRIDATKKAMSFAYSLGASVVVNAVGFVPEESSHPAYRQLQASLTDLAKFGQHVGSMLACETGSEPVERLVTLLDSLPDRAIGIAFNPGNLIINDCYEENSIRHCASRVLAVIARDGVRDLARGRGIEVPLGRGSAEFPHLLGVLEEQHYRGWFVLERTNSENPLVELGNAISFLRHL